MEGILLEASNGGGGYFTLGITSSGQLLTEFRDREGEEIVQVSLLECKMEYIYIEVYSFQRCKWVPINVRSVLVKGQGRSTVMYNRASYYYTLSVNNYCCCYNNY